MINLLPLSTTSPITENPWKRLIAGVVDTGDKFVSGVDNTAEQFIAKIQKPVAAVIKAKICQSFSKSIS